MKNVNWFNVKVAVCLLIGLLLQEASGLVYSVWPETEHIYFSNLYLDKGYKQPITVLYFIYELMPYLKDALFFYVLSIVLVKISSKLYYISLVFFGYYCVQACFYIWDRNTSYFRNFCVYICIAWVLMELLIRSKKEGRIINFE